MESKENIKTNNSHLLPTQEKWVDMTKNEIKHIFVYYIVLYIISLLLSVLFIWLLSGQHELSLVNLLIFSFLCGLLGSTFYYIRKLYKSCIQLLISPFDEKNYIRSLGVKIYFYFRPIMGATLATLIVLGIYGGFFFLQDNATINAEKFYIFASLLSFMIGFSNGKIIIQLDESKEKISKMIKIKKEDNNYDK